MSVIAGARLSWPHKYTRKQGFRRFACNPVKTADQKVILYLYILIRKSTYIYIQMVKHNNYWANIPVNAVVIKQLVQQVTHQLVQT